MRRDWFGSNYKAKRWLKVTRLQSLTIRWKFVTDYETATGRLGQTKARESLSALNLSSDKSGHWRPLTRDERKKLDLNGTANFATL